MDFQGTVKKIQNSKYSWVFSILEYLLIFFFGFLVAQTLSMEGVQNECDQFVVDTYFTIPMQRCMTETGGEMGVPFGDIGDYVFNTGINPD